MCSMNWKRFLQEFLQCGIKGMGNGSGLSYAAFNFSRSSLM